MCKHLQTEFPDAQASNRVSEQPPSRLSAPKMSKRLQTEFPDVPTNSMGTKQARSCAYTDQQSLPEQTKEAYTQVQPNLPSLTLAEQMKLTETQTLENTNQGKQTKTDAWPKKAVGKRLTKEAIEKALTGSQQLQQQPKDHPSTRANPNLNKKLVRPDPEAEWEVIIVGNVIVGRIVPNVETNVDPPKWLVFCLGKRPHVKRRCTILIPMSEKQEMCFANA
ncbi:hypothetical protein HPB51_019341 [Rhipicephalus microplus]|uniref:Uncharacterized protein n=1 Tax=Rhipicephalus microplus TaxID=6941 RepID=A0A9J6D6G9_RHIMP|nr:hypothetical protein HPB51_019341 [Rhipicephalus microplus]